MKNKSNNGNVLTKKVYSYPHSSTYPKLRGEELSKAIDKAHKDHNFMAEIRKFIKVTTS